MLNKELPTLHKTFKRKSSFSHCCTSEWQVTSDTSIFMEISGRLACPQAPCINVGSRRQPNYIPTELCHVVAGQRLVRGIKLNERQIADILKLAAKKPADRAKFIEKAVTEEAKFPSDPVLKSFGVQVAPKMSEVTIFSHARSACAKRQYLCRE